jgi:hypothetical protein
VFDVQALHAPRLALWTGVYVVIPLDVDFIVFQASCGPELKARTKPAGQTSLPLASITLSVSDRIVVLGCSFSMSEASSFQNLARSTPPFNSSSAVY